MNKRYSLDQLAILIGQERRAGTKIVLANGCFDLIHVGHIRYLRESKERGDLLVVAINSDSSVRRLKGRGRPILDEEERVAVISSFAVVDYVTVFDEMDVAEILRALKPDIHAKGSDYTEETVPERKTVLSYGGTTAITGGPKVKSTSEIILSIRNRLRSPNS